jgi:hypothetical protein
VATLVRVLRAVLDAHRPGVSLGNVIAPLPTGAVPTGERA